MDNKNREYYEELLGKELLEGLLQLSKIEPSIEAALNNKPVEDFPKRLVASFLIVIDNRNKLLQRMIQMSNIKL